MWWGEKAYLCLAHVLTMHGNRSVARGKVRIIMALFQARRPLLYGSLFSLRSRVNLPSLISSSSCLFILSARSLSIPLSWPYTVKLSHLSTFLLSGYILFTFGHCWILVRSTYEFYIYAIHVLITYIYTHINNSSQY